MPISAEVLAAAMRVPTPRAGRFVAALVQATNDHGIDTPVRQAGFVAQVGHESLRLSTLEEALDLPAERLPSLYPHAFRNQREARPYARNPEALANRIYAGLRGNGDESSGDGWRYRPRGLVRVWGRQEYLGYGEALGMDLVGTPDLLATPLVASDAAAWRWAQRRCNRFCDADDLNGMTRAFVDHLSGMAERHAAWILCCRALDVPARDAGY